VSPESVRDGLEVWLKADWVAVNGASGGEQGDRHPIAGLPLYGLIELGRC